MYRLALCQWSALGRGLQTRHASIPKPKGGIPGRNGNVHYRVWSQMAMAPEVKGIKSNKLDIEMLKVKDPSVVANEALEKETVDEYEKFPWERYGKAITYCGCAIAVTVLVTLYALMLYSELETLKYQYSLQQNKVKQLTQLTRQYQTQIDSYKAAFDIEAGKAKQEKRGTEVAAAAEQ
eukprot:TRINITY_DN32194_c0_g1_i1.p1 TRINITY_DN32194_c0_g1~~TRINITY_DN32194_c0_g1_i1.p1  ORF type:complete len:179 (+),score=49.46 TRINITY_DN32194_c0_g1_i1:51-587(+)